MRKFLLALLALAVVAALVGCALSLATSTGTPTATEKPTPTADVASAIPATGFVVALYNNPPVYLYAGPGDSYTILGQLIVGKTAQLLGIDPTSQWFLVKINGITAWVNSTRVSATIAQ